MQPILKLIFNPKVNHFTLDKNITMQCSKLRTMHKFFHEKSNTALTQINQAGVIKLLCFQQNNGKTTKKNKFQCNISSYIDGVHKESNEETEELFRKLSSSLMKQGKNKLCKETAENVLFHGNCKKKYRRYQNKT